MKLEIKPEDPRWLAISRKLPDGWHVHDVLDMPQFGVLRVGARHRSGSVDVPIAHATLVCSTDVDATIVHELTGAIARTEARDVADR